MTNKQLVRFSIISLLLIFVFSDSYGLYSKRMYNQRWKLRRYEVGGGIGICQVFGDIGGTAEQKNWYGLRDFKLDETRMVYSLYARYKIDPVYSLKVNTFLGFGHGDDADSRNDRGRSYKTRLFEISTQGEFYFISEERRYRSAGMFNRRGMLNNYSSASAYGFLGLGVVFSNAKVDYSTTDPGPYDDIKKKNVGAVIPIGVGLKYVIDDRWLINSELGYRLAFTDYIEGFTQTQASKHNDMYYFFTLSLSYRLETSRRGIPAMLDRRTRRIR